MQTLTEYQRFLRQVYASSMIRSYCHYEGISINALSMRLPDVNISVLKSLYDSKYMQVADEVINEICHTLKLAEHMVLKAKENGWTIEAISEMENTLYSIGLLSPVQAQEL